MTLRELKETVRALIGKGDLKDAFERLSRHLNPEREVFSQLTDLSAWYNRTFRDEMHNLLPRESANLEYSRVTNALLKLVNSLVEEDLGEGGSLDDPLEEMARSIAVSISLTPLYLVNCDRTKPVRFFWRAFGRCREQQRRFQFYLLPSCPTQQPESLAERTVWELVEQELDKVNEAVNFRCHPQGERLLVEPLPVGINEEGCRRAFKKYFTERFGIGQTEVAFEDYIRTGLPKLPWEYVVTVFKITAADWDEEIMVPYTEWIMDTFSQTRTDIPTFLFFFVVSVKNAHRSDASLRSEDREALDGARTLAEKRPDQAMLIEPLPPVHTDDLEYWLEKLGDVPQHQKERVIDLIAQRLGKEEAAWFDQRREFNMERIEDFQEKVYRAHQNK